MTTACILCDSNQLTAQTVDQKTYFSCAVCDLIFLNLAERLSSALEKERYQKHENNVLDQGYQNFVRPLYDLVIQKFSIHDLGLDYGSGKDSAISYLLNESGYQVKKYDPFFFNESAALAQTYDYIIVCEVAEHFYDPKAEFNKLKNMLKPNGRLFVMTSLVTDQVDFAKWSYRRDVTHVCFYSKVTCEYLKQHFQLTDLQIINDQVISFKK